MIEDSRALRDMKLTYQTTIERLERRVKALEAQQRINNNYIAMLEGQLKTARELIVEVYSQCQDENDWLQKADKWLGEAT